jgi:mannitol-1-phosphate 5-dehydrogenase
MKKAIIYGAGNIGRGFIGQLFSQSGYEVVFFDVNTLVIDRLNLDHRYPLRIINNNGYREELIENVRGVNSSDINKAIGEIASADIMAVAVGVNALPSIVKTIASGLTQRWQNDNFLPFNIIICENLFNANHILDKLIKQELETRYHQYFNDTIGLVEASIGRMVPKILSEIQQDNPLQICVEEYCELPVDKSAFKGKIPEIVNMMPFTPFNYYIQRKLYMHNMAHSLSAYLGFYEKKQYLWEACEDYKVKIIALRALFESSLAISEENNIQVKVLYEHAEDLLFRFGNKALGDTIERVGKDPVRKLSRNDRLIGAGIMCQKYGINPVFISIGIAAGFVFTPSNDEMAVTVQERISEKGIANAISESCGIDASNNMFGMVVSFYEMFKQGADLKKIIEEAEWIKQ